MEGIHEEKRKEALKNLPLLSYYSSLGAEIGEFAGWRSPLWFTSNREEHLSTRFGAGLFDITHMTRIAVMGRDAVRQLQHVLTIDVERLKPGKMKYCLMCNERGGIIDDLTVFKHPNKQDYFIIVSNAITHDRVLEKLLDHSRELDVEIVDLTFETTLFALQGPRSLELASKLTGRDLSIMKWFTGFETTINDIPVLITRSGYTGENGYEFMFWTWDMEELKKIWDKIVALGAAPCGLAARDSLRLEAGYPLYGYDMDEETNPIEARLEFAIDFSKEYFIGKEAIIGIKECEELRRFLVSFKCIEKVIPRRGYEVLDEDGQLIGNVTSGGFSFILGIGIGLGYVKPRYAVEGERLKIKYKEGLREIEVTLKPIIPHRMK